MTAARVMANQSILNTLPDPPAGQTGWPWTLEGAERPTEPAPSAALPPRISLVTPSFNQAPFLEATLRSVLLQGYPNLDYRVVDGGSTDGSVELIRRYAPWLSGWVSEPDGGQADAINKGFAQASGEILGWLNSDDILLPGALARAAAAFAQHPGAVLVYGGAEMLGADGRRQGAAPQVRACDRAFLLSENNAIAQPAAFFRRPAFQQAGGLATELYYSMDYDLWLRLSAAGELIYIPEPLAGMRLYAEAKTGRGDCRMFAEIKRVVEQNGGHGLPTQMAAWLVAVVLPRALAALREGQAEAGQADLACVLEYAPAWRSPERLAQTIAGEAWRLAAVGAGPAGAVGERLAGATGEWTAADALDWAAGVCRGLPPAWVSPRQVERQTLGLLYEALAFRSYRQRQYGAVRRYAWQAAAQDRRRLTNRGLWSATLRSILKSPAAGQP